MTRIWEEGYLSRPTARGFGTVIGDGWADDETKSKHACHGRGCNRGASLGWKLRLDDSGKRWCADHDPMQ